MNTETPPIDWLATGDLVLADRIVEGGTVAVAGGKIAGVFEAGESPSGPVVRDYSGRYILPGLVDTHVHASSVEPETIESSTGAAAAGGVTTIVDMPYDRAAPVMGIDRLREKVETVQAEAIVDVGLYGTMPKVDGVGVLDELVEGGVCAFKFSLFEYDAHRFPRIADGDLVAAFEKLSASGVPIVLHNELQEIVDYALAQLLDTPAENDPLAHGLSHPPVSETAASVKALDFAYWTGARLHLAHCTHPHTFRLIDVYRQLGADVSGETCAHYLVLSERDVAELGPIAKVNPPIRDEQAREDLWRALQDGRIATISTDHAPWPIEKKQSSMLRASPGAPGLETLLAAIFTEGEKRGVALPELLGYLTWRPAEIFGLGDRKGQLVVGMDADLTVFDARTPHRYDATQSLCSAKWSPFDGREFAGRVVATYVRGEIVFEDGRLVGEPGSGEWLRRTALADGS